MRYIFTLCLFFPFLLMGQYNINSNKNNVSNNNVKFKEFSAIPTFVKFEEGAEIHIDELDSWLRQTYELDQNTVLELINTSDDELGFTHYRYQQTINGFPVELSRYNVHVKSDMIQSINGVLFSDHNLSGIQILEHVALEKALNFVDAETYKWQIPAEERYLKI